jgi:hypothetical protein
MGPVYSQLIRLLRPLNISIEKVNRRPEFTVSYKTRANNGTNIRSYIGVKYNKANKTAELTHGRTHNKHQKKYIGSALRAIATWMLYKSKYKLIKHSGSNIEFMVKEPNKNYPYSTRIVRKMGYAPNTPNKPSGKTAIYYSFWRPTPAAIANLERAMLKARNNMHALKFQQLS